MTRPDSDSGKLPDDPTDNAHLIRGLTQPPSAHGDPPASVVGPTGERETPVSDAARAALASRQSKPAVRPEALSYDNVVPRSRGGSGTKLLLGATAVIAAALAYFFLPKFGFGPGNGHGGASPGSGGAAPSPPAFVDATQPSISPTVSPTTSGVETPIPTAPLHVTIQDETYRLGAVDGQAASLDQVLNLAKNAKPGSPVIVDLNDSSRAAAEDHLRAAFDHLQIPMIWTRDGKPVSGDLPGPGKAAVPVDGARNK